MADEKKNRAWPRKPRKPKAATVVGLVEALGAPPPKPGAEVLDLLGALEKSLGVDTKKPSGEDGGQCYGPSSGDPRKGEGAAESELRERAARPSAVPPPEDGPPGVSASPANAASADERPLVLRLPTGLHYDVPPDEYHRRCLGLASKGALDELRRSPRRYRAWVDGELLEEQNDAFDLGAAAHCAILEPERFALAYAVAPKVDRRTTAGKEAHAAWLAEHPGARPLSEEQAMAIGGMTRAILAHPIAAALLEEGRAEVTARWTDGATGIECRARFDWLTPTGIAVDLKTTTDARPRVFAKSAGNFSYFRQAAFYVDGAAGAGAPLEEDLDGPRFLFVAVEKLPPYSVSVSRLDEAALRLGRRTIAEDLATLARCLETDTWPAYGEGIEILSLPPWIERDW